jgi:hypothetical protein
MRMDEYGVFLQMASNNSVRKRTGAAASVERMRASRSDTRTANQALERTHASIWGTQTLADDVDADTITLTKF